MSNIIVICIHVDANQNKKCTWTNNKSYSFFHSIVRLNNHSITASDGNGTTKSMLISN